MIPVVIHTRQSIDASGRAVTRASHQLVAAMKALMLPADAPVAIARQKGGSREKVGCVSPSHFRLKVSTRAYVTPAS